MVQENYQDSTDPLANVRWNRFCALTPEWREKVLQIVVGSIGVPQRYRDKDFPGWYDFENEIGAAWRNGDRPQSLILTGDVGTGKTGILCAALRSIIAARLLEGGTVAAEWQKITDELNFIHYRELTKTIRCFDDPEERLEAEKTFDKWCRIPLLAIDDLLNGTRSEWDLVKIGELIDRRYNAELPIWLSTNYSTSDLKGWPGFERAYSRLFEMAGGVVYELTGKDRRMKK